ncbi:hd family [Phlyctema vagabunda]|uniref:Hd family n=1 Tax=Phlyctema vagabunda TaxID=108571 RepID=A0ABR4P223_9HELO
MSSFTLNGDRKHVDAGFVETVNFADDWTLEKTLATIHPAPPASNSTSPIPFFHILERLKTTKREGWKRYGIEMGETIADHMYRMSLMTMLCPPSLASRVDLAKCMKMSLIHDMAESLVGDITPGDGVPKAEKSRREAETMDYISNNLLKSVYGGLAGAEIRTIWQEYEDSKTLESHFVHDIDKVELLCQMVEYEKRMNHTLDLEDFVYVSKKTVLPETQEWVKDILKERESFWAGKGNV